VRIFLDFSMACEDMVSSCNFAIESCDFATSSVLFAEAQTDIMKDPEIANPKI